MVYCYRCMWSTHRAARPTGVCKVHTQQQDQHVSSWQSFSRQDKNCLLYINHCFAWFQTWLWSSGEISNVYFFYGLTFRQFWGLVIYEQVHCRHAYHCKIMEKSCISRHHKIWKPSIFFLYIPTSRQPMLIISKHSHFSHASQNMFTHPPTPTHTQLLINCLISFNLILQQDNYDLHPTHKPLSPLT